MTPKPEQFLVDKHGRTKAVIMSLIDYRKLVRHLHDLEDALDLKHALATSRGTISHSVLLGQLKRSGIV